MLCISGIKENVREGGWFFWTEHLKDCIAGHITPRELYEFIVYE